MMSFDLYISNPYQVIPLIWIYGTTPIEESRQFASRLWIYQATIRAMHVHNDATGEINRECHLHHQRETDVL